PAQESVESQGGHLPDRFEDDRLRHLRAAGLAVGERDRDLDDFEPRAERAVRRLDLKRVSLRVDCVEVDRLEHPSPVALEAAGEVADTRPEQDARIPRAAGRDEASDESPVADAAAGDVARAKHEISVLR